jgi:hypothetical protein
MFGCSLDGVFLLVPPCEDVRKDLSSLEVCWAQSSAMSCQMERANRKNGATRKLVPSWAIIEQTAKPACRSWPHLLH